MEELSRVDEIDRLVTKNPNSIVVVYKEGCPWCEKLKKDMQELEKSGKAKVYLLNVDKYPQIVSKLGANGVPVTISFKECEATHVYEGYNEDIVKKLEEEYRDAEPVCRVDLSNVLFIKTKIGEPIL